MDKIEKMLLELGVPAHIRGFSYTHRALELLLEDTDKYTGFHHRLYRQLMVEFGNSECGIEAGIRRAIEKAFDNMSPEIQEEYFGRSVNYEKGKANNKQFLMTLARRLKKDDGCD